jgi:hypothetical protein
MIIAFVSLTVGLLTGAVSCERPPVAPTAVRFQAGGHSSDVYDDGTSCPPEGCRPPTATEHDSISNAIDYVMGHAYEAGSASNVCADAASAARGALNGGQISIGDYDGISHWTGTHPNVTWNFTELGANLFDPNLPPPPPPYIELVVAHEFIHVTQHMHHDPDENQVEALAEQCVFGG